MITPNPDYPIRLEVDYPESLSRLLIFVKWLLAIPHYLILAVLGIGAFFALLVAWFAVIITGVYPVNLFGYLVGVMRWGVRVFAYVSLLTDRYPPFSLADDPSYPVRLEVDYPERIANWRPLVHWLLVFPAAIVVGLLHFVSAFSVLLAWFAILITGRFPQGIFEFVVITYRWTVRTTAYEYWMTARYPPFVWA